jgi:hypothetical protein
MDGSSDIQDQMLATLLNRELEPARYWRLQTEIAGCNFAMDDASESNIRCLLALGRQLAANNRANLANLVDQLRT